MTISCYTLAPAEWYPFTPESQAVISRGEAYFFPTSTHVAGKYVTLSQLTLAVPYGHPFRRHELVHLSNILLLLSCLLRAWAGHPPLTPPGAHVSPVPWVTETTDPDDNARTYRKRDANESCIPSPHISCAYPPAGRPNAHPARRIYTHSPTPATLMKRPVKPFMSINAGVGGASIATYGTPATNKDKGNFFPERTT